MLQAMPQRPRSHRVETESRTAFRALCDSVGWIARDMDTEGDYGIDLEVEIFSRDRTTGLTFRVQMKGSDRDVEARRSIAIKLDSLDYWRSFDVPVLLVFYAAQSGNLYGQWAHAHDLGRHFDANAKTTTFVFSDASLLNAARMSELEQDIRLIRAYKQRAVPFPITVDITVRSTKAPAASDSHAALDTTEARLALRSLSPRTAGLLSLAAPEGRPLIRLEVGPDMMRARLAPDITTVTLHEYAPARQTFLDDALLAMAILLSNVGWNVEAARLLTLVNPTLQAIWLPEIAPRVADILIKSEKFDTLLSIGSTLTSSPRPEPREAGVLFLACAQSMLELLTTRQQKRLMKALSLLARLESSSEAPARAGVHYYNAGQAHNILGNWMKAAEMYKRAEATDARYAQRGYFHSEYAGILWKAGLYTGAATRYERALSLGGDPGEIEPLLVESYMWAGEYAKGLHLAEKWKPRSGPLNHLATVNRIALRMVVNTAGLDAQNRRPVRSRELRSLKEGGAREGILAVMRAADALDIRLWELLLEIDESIETVATLVTMAHLDRKPGGWAVATAAAITLEAPHDAKEAVIGYGLQVWGDQYLEAVRNVAALSGVEKGDLLLEEVQKRAASQPETSPDTTIRLYSPDDPR